MNSLALFFDESLKAHDTGAGHPERPARLNAVRGALHGAGLLTAPRVPQRVATLDELAAVHARAYLAQAQRDVAAGLPDLSTGDTAVCPASWDVATRAAGGVIAVVDAVCSGTHKAGFAGVRPPGHHATRERGMGFCLVNNIAVGARYAQRQFGVERVLIVDWDVHHGNGTQDIFYEDGSVLFFSTHQHPWYPGTGMAHERGAGAGEGTTVNVPLPAGSDGRNGVTKAVLEQLLPTLNEFRPELIMISAGFDSRIGDPLGRFILQDADFRVLTHLLRAAADNYCQGRLVSVLEGGYSLEGLQAGLGAHLKALID